MYESLQVRPMLIIFQSSVTYISLLIVTHCKCGCGGGASAGEDTILSCLKYVVKTTQVKKFLHMFSKYTGQLHQAKLQFFYI